MAQSDTRIQGDAYVSFEGGVDSNLRPELIQPNQLAWAANCVVRGGAIAPRPGFIKRDLTYKAESDETTFQDATAKFQGAGYYRASNGQSELLVSVGGRIYAIDPEQSYQLRDVTPSSGRNSQYQDVVHFEQAEDWSIIQDGQSAPIFYNRADSRRSAALVDEIPTGAVSAYANGRVWVSRKSEYAAGDLVGSSSGDPQINRRDAVLKFTENDYLNEGGAFGTPSDAGDIVSMQVVGALDTATGDAELVVFTKESTFATTVPVDRTSWKNLTYPVQRLVAPKGAVSSFSPVNVNGDIYYRSTDGIRSLIFARRDFADPGMSPVSNEVNRALAMDDPNLLKHSSATLFDNRLLHTCVGRKTSRGVAHQALVSLDFDPASGLRTKAPLAYDGVWTGLDMLHVISGSFSGKERCFIFAVVRDQIQLWEIDPTAKSDYNGTNKVGINWYFETRSIPFTSPFELTVLDRFESWIGEVNGEVDFTLYTRPDDSRQWYTWASWQENAKTQLCDSDAVAGCLPLREYRPSYRPRRSLADPPCDLENLSPGKQVNRGYSFQFRLQGTGYARVDALRFFSQQINEDVDLERPATTATETSEYGCPLQEYPAVTI